MTVRSKSRELWQAIKRLFYREIPGTPRNPSIPQSGGSPRYSVQSTEGDELSASDTLKQAHQRWKDLTDQDGRIIDRQSGEDVTPEKDDMGRYVVIDANGDHVASFDQLHKAKNFWSSETSQQGKIIDSQTGEDVTPNKDFLSSEEIEKLLNKLSDSPPSYSDHGSDYLTVDHDMVKRIIKQIVSMRIPVFDVANIAGSGIKVPKKKVPIKRRKVEIETKREKVYIEELGKPQPSGRIFHPSAIDDYEYIPMRNISDIVRAPRRTFGLPKPILERAIVKKSIPIRQWYDDVDGKPTVRKRAIWKDVEVPVVKEWTEELEVSDEPKSQLLEIVIDVSGSMDGIGITIAIALACTIIEKHINDGSRYIVRPFANYAGDARNAASPKQKSKLISWLDEELAYEDLGGGTNILEAITVAAEDVRSRAGSADTPEVLLITDGEDSLYADDVYGAIRDDVILHTVIVNGYTNSSLRAHSSTYYDLSIQGTHVKNAPAFSGWDYED